MINALCLFIVILIGGNSFANQVFDFRTAKNPEGYQLNQVCYNYDSYISIVEKSICSNFKEVYADQDQKYKLSPRMRQTCVEWDRIPAGEVVPLTIVDCIKWEKVKNYFFDKKSGPKQKCVKRGPVEVPRVQRLDVYNKFSSHTGISSEDQHVGSQMFVVPFCR